MKLCDDYIQFIEKYLPEPYNTPETFGDYLLPKIQHHEIGRASCRERV